MEVDRAVRIARSNILEVEVFLGCDEKNVLKLRNELLYRIPQMSSAETSYAVGNDQTKPQGHCVTGDAMVKADEVERFKTDIRNLVRALKDEGIEVTNTEILVENNGIK
ncbi:MAG: hypothetical protein ACREBW_07960 [Candidatus Micrarchaeaceae archaeon]